MTNFEPPIAQAQLPSAVYDERAAFEVARSMFDAELQPRIDGHLYVLQGALDSLIELHVGVVETSDLDMAAPTRWVGLWELAGRCLALGTLLVAELRLGFTAETVGTMRVINEATHLVHAVAADRGLMERWLNGETVMPRDVRPIIQQQQADADAARAAAGLEVLDADVVALNRRIYHLLSQGAHNARPGFVETVSASLRQFNYGPHPDARQRAVYTDYASELIEGMLIAVGDALAHLFGGEWYMNTIPPLQAELHAVREALPIGDEARAALGF